MFLNFGFKGNCVFFTFTNQSKIVNSVISLINYSKIVKPFTISDLGLMYCENSQICVYGACDIFHFYKFHKREP